MRNRIEGRTAFISRFCALIRKHQPLFARPSAKTARYELNDRFLIFWFRFFYRYSYVLELKGYEMLRKLILRDYNVFSGQALEDYFRHQYAESGRWTRIGSWWDRKGENEIDLLCENELDGTYCIGEVKRDKGRIANRSLADKLSAFRRATGKWRSADPVFMSLSLEDM